MPDETSKVLTLVFTDLADSTALKSERGDQIVQDLIRRHREVVQQLVAECSGRVIDWAGDGCFLTFDTSSAGVMFALRLQQVNRREHSKNVTHLALVFYENCHIEQYFCDLSLLIR